ncbi:hypothetical protein LRAMOSA02844 [Lichtheimia ramosa]|uniref:Membrane insertase YidC/Oxa/ALB C-terminal domain-containing protein n=1 Tax=Lichtheimia ramosa TaxID=688394 RepID=A0A077WU18_9FUNG|nr:hypothetical protein LRAMOSA02844 [Lichtheimia ramosa]
MPRLSPAAVYRHKLSIPYRHCNNTTRASSLPIVLAANESLLESVHAAGVPWWTTIVGLTCLLRSSLTLPIAVYQQRSIGRMIELAPMVQSWGETLKTHVATESRKAGWDYARYSKELQRQYRRKVNELYKQYGCQRWKLLSLPYVQIPLFVSMSLTIRHMTGMPLPWYGQTAENPADGMNHEGLAWFTDLTVPDPTMTFPLLIGAGTLLNVELNAWLAKDRKKTLTQKILTNAFRILAVAFVPIAAHAPMSLGLYWCTSAWFSVVQNVAFRIPWVRQVLKMPQLTPPSQNSSIRKSISSTTS